MKERGTKKIQQWKHLSLKMSKNVTTTEKKKNNISDKSYVPTRGVYLQKLPHVLTWDEPVVQYDISVLENAFFDDCK